MWTLRRAAFKDKALRWSRGTLNPWHSFCSVTWHNYWLVLSRLLFTFSFFYTFFFLVLRETIDWDRKRQKKRGNGSRVWEHVSRRLISWLHGQRQTLTFRVHNRLAARTWRAVWFVQPGRTDGINSIYKSSNSTRTVFPQGEVGRGVHLTWVGTCGRNFFFFFNDAAVVQRRPLVKVCTYGYLQSSEK